MLREISHIQNDKHTQYDNHTQNDKYDSIYMSYLSSQIQRQEAEWWFRGAGGREE